MLTLLLIGILAYAPQLVNSLSIEAELPTDWPSVYFTNGTANSYDESFIGNIGDTITIALVVSNLTDSIYTDPDNPLVTYPLGNLKGFDVQMSWDSSILRYVTHTVTVSVEDYPDPVSPSPYAGILRDDTIKLKDVVNEDGNIPLAEPGTMAWFAYATMPGAPVFNGNGTFFTMTFNVINEGYCSLNLTNLYLEGDGGVEFEVKHHKFNGVFCTPDFAQAAYIRADGTIDPSDAPISTVDNVTYTLTGNITCDTNGILIERDNIILDGAGYTIQETAGNDMNGICLDGRSNVTVTNMTILKFKNGVWLKSSSNNSIVGNSITNNFDGVAIVFSSSNNSISGNSITNNECGVYLSNSNYNNVVENNITASGIYGIYLGYSLNNRIVGNNITNNEWFGACIMLYSSSSNSVVGNKITDNMQGIYLSYSSSNNSITGNNIADNYYGIEVSSSSNNAFYHNNFVDNAEQAYVEPGHVNIWDDGYPSGGNYWSDYSGVDFYSGSYQNETNSDGIGDTTYTIDDNNVDNYPLMMPWESPVSYQSNTTITNVVVTRKILSFETSGPDGTVGFINVTMRMDFNSSAITVFVDDAEITPAITTNGIHYFIYFEFTQSIHNITIKYAIVDIALTNLATSKTVVGQGCCINISVTAENHGSSTENFKIKVYANTTIIDTKPVTITAWSSTTVIFTWNTTGFAKGNYNITAYATPVQGETATTDNTVVADECVLITIPGDLDADFDVDLFDAVKLLVIYGNKIGNPDYDPVCDINSDGDIDLYDAVILLTHYGQKYP